MNRFLRILVLAAAVIGAGLTAAERIPPAPPRYFNDNAGLVAPGVATALNARLEQYERETSNQILVAIYPHMESDSSIEDYTVRVAEAWKVGQQGRNNGAVLFVFKDDHKLYIQVGYGLEPTLTDAIASQIVQQQLKPAFRAGDYAGGLRTAVDSMIAATKGEFKGTGRTAADGRKHARAQSIGMIVIFIVMMLFSWALSRQRNHYYAGRRRRGMGGVFWTGGGGFGGGGGFSGGGGSFGGGGAGGSW